jgi:hypothetical protein
VCKGSADSRLLARYTTVTLTIDGVHGAFLRVGGHLSPASAPERSHSKVTDWSALELGAIMYDTGELRSIIKVVGLLLLAFSMGAMFGCSNRLLLRRNKGNGSKPIEPRAQFDGKDLPLVRAAVRVNYGDDISDRVTVQLALGEAAVSGAMAATHTAVEKEIRLATGLVIASLDCNNLGCQEPAQAFEWKGKTWTIDFPGSWKSSEAEESECECKITISDGHDVEERDMYIDFSIRRNSREG